MGIIKLPENYGVSQTRQSVRDALTMAGEQCIALSMYHPEIDKDHGMCPYCFAPETLVRTEAGYRPIGEIVTGDRVLSGDGTYQRVAKVMVRPFAGTAYRWRTSAMTRPVIATEEHPIWALDADHQHNNKTYIRDGKPFCGPSVCEPYYSTTKGFRGDRHQMVWLPARKLNDRSWVAMRVPVLEADLDEVRVPESFVGPWRRGPDRFELTEDFLWMVGLYLAEGSCNKRSIAFGLHEDEIEYQGRLLRIFTEYGYGPKVVRQASKHGVVVEVHSSTLAQWFPAWLGRGCQNKRIPEELMALPPKKAKVIVEGIWCGDGYKKFTRIGQTSEVLALQITEVLQRNGEQSVIHVNTSPRPAPSGRARKTSYHNCWSPDGYRKKQIKGRWFFNQKEQLARVMQHEQVFYDGLVYNLEVEGDHTYVVQNTLVHNCGDDVYSSGDGDCTECYGTTMYPPVKEVRRVYGIFTPRVVSEQFLSQGIWSLDSREVQIEWYPLLVEHDFIVRVRQWDGDPVGPKPTQLEGVYSVQAVTQDPLYTGTRFAQSTMDIIGQRAVITKLAHNLPIYSYPVIGRSFAEPVDLSGPVVVTPPDTRVVVVPSRGEDAENYTFTQDVPLDPWVIVHPLNHYPSVTLIVGGKEVKAPVSYPAPDTVIVTFGQPVAGTAELL